MERSTRDSSSSPSRPPPSSGWGQTFAALHYFNFRLLFISTIFVSAGNWVQQITLGWLAVHLSPPETAPLQAAIVLGLRGFPMLLAPVAGVIADRFDRRRIFLLDQAFLATLAVIFAVALLLDVVEMWHLYVFSFVAGVGWSVNNPIRQTLISNSVPRESLMNAVALHAMAFNSMRMIGPMVGGAMIALLGPGMNFVLQAAMYVGVFLLLIPYKAEYASERPPSTQSPMKDLLEGLRYIRGQRITLTTILMGLIPTFFIMAFIMTQMPVYADQIIGDDSGWSLGWLMGAMGVGGFVGTIVMARFSRIVHKGRLVLVATTGAAVGVVALSQATTLAVAIPLLIVQQAFFMAIMTANNTILQTLTPDGMRGRVMGVYMIDIGLQPLGGLLAGLIATAYGVPFAWVVGGVVGLVAAGVVAVWIPSFRKLQV